MSGRPLDVDPGAAALHQARQVADAVLYEGYVLFPYRASAAKNRFRWQWGVVIPEAQRELGHAEAAEAVCEVLVRTDGAGAGTVEVTARFLRLRHRQMVDGDGHDVEQLRAGEQLIPTWDEGVEHEVLVEPVPLRDPGAAAQPIRLPGRREVEVHAGAGSAVRTLEPVHGEVRVACEALDERVRALTVTIANTTGWAERRAPRDAVLRRSFVGVHVLLRATGGAAIASGIDPPAWAAPWTQRRRGRGLHPVLAGLPVREPGEAEPRAAGLALALPIVLSDFPAVAPESVGQSFDATEVDELLALCVLGLSDAEKAEARATDPRAAELIDRTTTLSPAVLERLHGTVRSRSAVPPADDPGARHGGEPSAGDAEPVSPEALTALGVGESPVTRLRVAGVDLESGSRVRLRPRRRADAQDVFLDGRVGVVERLVETDDGQSYVAVTVEGDPAAELHRWYGRYHYFGSDEIEPLVAGPGGTAAGGATTAEGGTR